MRQIPQPMCPKCRSEMTLARTTPGPKGYGFRTLQCTACKHLHNVLVELEDPMASEKTRRWLLSELHPPE